MSSTHAYRVHGAAEGDYLGGAKPDQTLAADAGVAALVHEGEVWLSADELEFRGGGESDIVYRYRIEEEAPREVGMAPRRRH